MRARLFLAFLLLLAPFLVPGVGAAQAQRAQPLDRLLPQIRRAHPGQFFDADGPTPGPDGQPHYHLKWMTPDGRIVWLDADARTGRVLRQSPGRDTFDAPRSEAPRSDFRDQGSRDDARAYGRPAAPDDRSFGPDRGPDRGYGSRNFGPSYGSRGGNRDFGGRQNDNRGFGNRGFGGGRGRGDRR